MRICRLAGLAGLLAFSLSVFAGGAWLPAPGHGDFQLGYSRKTASSSWDASGDAFANTTAFEGHTVSHYHDFRYAYLSGEVGLHRRVSARFLITHLHGLEGPHAELEKNVGWSDAWIGAKFALSQGNWPQALAVTMRTPVLYDRPGAYNRYIRDDAGNILDVSSEWRGVLKRDYTLSYMLSRSLREGRGWMNLETGYTVREGAPADQVPFTAELGWPLPWRNIAIKGSLATVASLGNDSPSRPDDRFRSRDTFNFNDASMARAGISFVVPVRGLVDVEVGYNQWIWGKSARRYREPFISASRRF